MASTTTALTYAEEVNAPNDQSNLFVSLMDGNSVTQSSAFISVDFDAKSKMHPKESYCKKAETKTSVTRFPLRSYAHEESQLFPISFVKSDRGISPRAPLEKSEVMGHNHYGLALYMRNIGEFSFHDDVKKSYEVKNLSSIPEALISNELKCLNQISCQNRFPTSQIKNSTKFPSKLVHLTSSEYTCKVGGKLHLQKPIGVNSGKFPINESPLAGSRSETSYGDKLVFPMKTDLLFKIRAVPASGEENNTLSSTMTQSNSFMHANLNGEKLVEIYTEKQTNLENSEHDRKVQKQIMYVHKRSYNDDVLATEASKNTYVSGQPKRCGERTHIDKQIQNSRSASETQCSHENMNDLVDEYYHLQQQQQQQNKGKQVNRTNSNLNRIKTPSPSPPPEARSTIAAPEKKSAQITVQTEEQNFDDDASNPQTSRTNNLSDINFEHGQQPWSAYLTDSEVRDPSSQEDLLVDGRVVCESNIARINIEPIPPPAAESLSTNEATSTSSNYQLTPLSCPIQTQSATTQTTTATQHVQNDCQNFLNLKSQRVSPNGKSDVSAASSDPSLDGIGAKTSTESRRAGEFNDFVRGADIAMTITKVEEQKEADNINASLSYLDDNKNSFVDEGSLEEMKFEMNSAKSASNATLRSLGSSTQVKNEQIQAAAASGSSVLSAAKDVSKLANFGKARRESASLSRSESSASIDLRDSVLPTRTLLRRQRRMHSQYSQDKQEDPIERLNRLRARISGALNEVKGVLKHYSTDEGGETDQPLCEPNDSSTSLDSHKLTTDQTTVKDEGPVSFRFVKKIRRRSVFNEGETCELKEDIKCETIEANQTNDCEYNCHVPSEEINLEKGGIKDHDNITSIPVIENGNKSQEIENLALKSSAKLSMTSNENISEKFQGCIEDNILESAEPNLKPVARDNTVSDVAEVETKSCNTKDASMEIQSKATEPHIPNISANETKRPKKRLILKPKQNARRASIAAIEGSQIDPPVNIAIPLAIKTQRRPSDSEAIVKRKIHISESVGNAPIKNNGTVVKEKRPPVKKKSTTSTSKVDINQHNDRTKNAATTTHLKSSAITTVVDTAATQATIKTEVPIVSDLLLSTQLTTASAIGDAELDSGDKLDKTKSEVKQALSIATNAWRSSTKLSDENGEMVAAAMAAMASQLQAGEASSHTINAEKQPLSNLTDKAKEITFSTEKANDQCISEDRSALTLADVSKKPIDLEFQPTSQGVNADPGQLISCSEASNSAATLAGTEKVSSTTHLDTSASFNGNTLCPVQTLTVSSRRDCPEEQNIKEILNHNSKQPIAEVEGGDKMPEQQVTPTPVKPVQIFAENDAGKISFSKKKITIKRIIRKSSIDNATENKTSNKTAGIETKKDEDNHRLQLSSNLVAEKCEKNEEENILDDEMKTVEERPIESAIVLTEPKEPRKIKKKVIIKRQQRKLSVGETSFFKEPDQPDAIPAATETLERAIAYVTDDEDDTTGQAVEPVQPIKSCMKQREYQVGDWVMYGERFRKTQIRWKKGQIIERITSISYKIKIDDKEISAHISYIKKYTGRRVNFGGKEYLEIDYEQIAEEERRARTYSIWNMV